MQKPLLWGLCPAASVCFSRTILQICAKLEVCTAGCFVLRKVMKRCMFMLSLTTSAPLDYHLWHADDIEVTGIVTRQWLYSMPGARCNTDILLSANQLHKEQRQQLLTKVDPQAMQMFCKFWKDHADCPLAGRNAILASICPQLHGLCMIKLALMLMLIGGEQRVSKTGGQIRAEVHMLLVGDPGTGKSLQKLLPFLHLASSSLLSGCF